MPGSPLEVLLVEDAADDAELLARALIKRRPGTRIAVVHDGVEALRQLQGDDCEVADRPKLVVLDLNLPLLNGIQVLRCLSADRRTAAIPVFVVSGTCTPADVGASRFYGAKACMRKPYDGGDMSRLVEMLANELR